MNNHSKRAHALLSASSSARWLACPPSAVAGEAYPAKSTDFAREGTRAHEVAEAMVSERSVSLLPGASEYTVEMVECAEGYRDYIQEQITGDDAIVLLEQRVDFSNWVPNGFGTCDCIIIQGNTLTVIDYKYGKGVMVSAKDNPQMKLYALGALNDYGFAYDIEKIIMHIYQPRMNNISVDEISAEHLLIWAENAVKPIAEKAIKGQGKYTPGPHCRFCPHAGRCRALTKTCTELVETHGLKVKMPVLAPHEVAEVLEMEPILSLWLKRVKDQALATMMDGGEIPGFKVVEGKQGNRKWADELAVAKVLDAAGYSREDYIETKLIGPAAIDKLLGKKKAAEMLYDLIERAPGAPTIALESDKRSAFNRVDDFENLEE